MYDVLIVGGGAAGFFTAINLAEKNPKISVAILERGKEVLTKVRVSGGGVCRDGDGIAPILPGGSQPQPSFGFLLGRMAPHSTTPARAA